MDPLYYVSKAGQQFGPMTEAQVVEAVQKRRFSSTDLVWTEGGDWTPISSLFPSLGLNRPVPPPLPAAQGNGTKWLLGCVGVFGLMILGFIGLVVLAAVADSKGSSASVGEGSSHNSEDVASTPKEGTAKPPVEEKKQKNVYSVGDSFTLGTFQYQIFSATKSYTLQSVFQGGLSQEEIFGKMLAQKFGPQGNGPAYVIVTYSITNVGQEADDALTDNFKIVDSKNRKYSMLSEESSVLSGLDLPILVDLQPGIAQKAVQVFQLPKDSFDEDLMLVVPTTKMFSSDEAKVTIGKTIAAQAKLETQK